MARAAILLAILALLAVVANVVAGGAAGLRWMTVRGHSDLAVPTSVFALFAWMVVVFYFVGALAWVREEVDGRRLDPALAAEARAIRAAVLPWTSAAVLLLVAAYVLGGGADTGTVPPWVHLGLALLALLVHLVAVYRSIVFVGMMLDLQARVEGSGSTVG